MTRSALDARLVVEQRLVDGAELLDAEIAVGDALAPSAIGRRPRRQRHDRPPRGAIVEIAALGERRPRGREQPAVERRHAQIAGAAAGVREAGDRAQRVPEPRLPPASLGGIAQTFEAVALAIDGMPQRHERARFGEQQEQHAVDDRQRLLEAVVTSTVRLSGRSAAAVASDACERATRATPPPDAASTPSRSDRQRRRRGDPRPRRARGAIRGSSAASRSVRADNSWKQSAEQAADRRSPDRDPSPDDAAHTVGAASTHSQVEAVEEEAPDASRRAACVTARRQSGSQRFAPRRDERAPPSARRTASVAAIAGIDRLDVPAGARNQRGEERRRRLQQSSARRRGRAEHRRPRAPQDQARDARSRRPAASAVVGTSLLDEGARKKMASMPGSMATARARAAAAPAGGRWRRSRRWTARDRRRPRQPRPLIAA